jgi:hypothetical protein
LALAEESEPVNPRRRTPGTKLASIDTATTPTQNDSMFRFRKRHIAGADHQWNEKAEGLP